MLKKMKKKRKITKEFEDDNRTIAPMNVEGMPWHNKADKPVDSDSKKQSEPLSRSEMKHFMRGAFAAVIVICSIMGLAIFLFLMFAVHIWLK